MEHILNKGTQSMNILEAIEQAKQGRRVSREDTNEFWMTYADFKGFELTINDLEKQWIVEKIKVMKTIEAYALVSLTSTSISISQTKGSFDLALTNDPENYALVYLTGSYEVEK